MEESELDAEQGKDLKTEVDGLGKVGKVDSTVIIEDGNTVSEGMVTKSKVFMLLFFHIDTIYPDGKIVLLLHKNLSEKKLSIWINLGKIYPLFVQQ